MNARALVVSACFALLASACDRGQEAAPPVAEAPVADAPAPDLSNCKNFGTAATVTVSIRDAAVGDSVQGDFVCDGLGVLATCTATVPAGQTSATCTSAPVDVSGFDRAHSCPATVLAGNNPPYAVSCAAGG
jgi:hypothetical protein